MLGFIKFEEELELDTLMIFLNGPGFALSQETGDYSLGKFIEGSANGYSVYYRNEDNLLFMVIQKMEKLMVLATVEGSLKAIT